MPFASLLNKQIHRQTGGGSAGKLGTFLGVFTPTILTVSYTHLTLPTKCR